MRPSCLGVDASSQAAKPRVRCTAVRGRASAQNTYMPIYAQLASAINLRFPRINCSLHPVGSVKARMKSRQIEAPPRWRLSQSVETRLPHTAKQADGTSASADSIIDFFAISASLSNRYRLFARHHFTISQWPVLELPIRFIKDLRVNALI